MSDNATGSSVRAAAMAADTDAGFSVRQTEPSASRRFSPTNPDEAASSLSCASCQEDGERFSYPDLTCPRCGAPLRPVVRDNVCLFYGCTRFAETGCRGKRYFERDAMGVRHGVVRETCPECHQGLRKGVGKNGRPYCACFEKTDHKSQDAIFFNMDGTPKARPAAAGTFHCPECNGPLAYFEVQNGRHRGKKTFACLAADKHKTGKAHYWDDNGGEPAW